MELRGRSNSDNVKNKPKLGPSSSVVYVFFSKRPGHTVCSKSSLESTGEKGRSRYPDHLSEGVVKMLRKETWVAPGKPANNFQRVVEMM